MSASSHVCKCRCLIFLYAVDLTCNNMHGSRSEASLNSAEAKALYFDENIFHKCVLTSHCLQPGAWSHLGLPYLIIHMGEHSRNCPVAHLDAAAWALEVGRRNLLVILVIARWREPDAVPVEPIAAAVALQHGAFPIVWQLAQAVQLDRILHSHSRTYQP